MAAKEYVLWGYHDGFRTERGITPLKLTGGTLREVNAAYRQRSNERGWTLGIYAKGDEPTGLRIQCANEHGAFIRD